MLGSKREINEKVRALKDPTELVRTLMHSTATYVALHIDNEKNRFAYLRAMSRCFAACNKIDTKNNIGNMRTELLAVMHDATVNHKSNRFEFFSDTRKYYMMGIEHSLDIVKSISKRFDLGYLSMTEEHFERSILRVLHCDIKN